MIIHIKSITEVVSERVTIGVIEKKLLYVKHGAFILFESLFRDLQEPFCCPDEPPDHHKHNKTENKPESDRTGIMLTNIFWKK